MKKVHIFCFVLVGIANFVNGQIINDTLEINQFQTSQIVFPDDDEIEILDIGTGQSMIVSRKIQNLVLIQSSVSVSSYVPTNAFIKTKNGIYLNLYLKFVKNSKKQSLIIGSSANQITRIVDVESSKVKPLVSMRKKLGIDHNRIIDLLQKQRDKFKPSADFHSDISLEFYGHYLINNVIYYKFILKNKSNLDYYFEDIFLSIRKLKQRQASKTERPIYINEEITNTEIVSGKSEQMLVFALDAFSINKKEELVFDLKEGNNGNRDFLIKVPHYVVNNPIKI